MGILKTFFFGNSTFNTIKILSCIRKPFNFKLQILQIILSTSHEKNGLGRNDQNM